VSDAHERLRQYLEQRREMGEREFILDGMSVEDAFKMLTGRTPPPAPPAGRSAEASAGPPAQSSTGSAPRARAEERPAPPPSDSAMRRAAEEAAASGDWRDALRAVDAGTSSNAAASRPPTASSRAGSSADSNRESPAAESVGAGGAKGAAASTEGAEVPDEGPIEIGANAAPSAMAHLTDLTAVANAVSACAACTLASTAQNHVPGEGNPAARFVVVGEAPGAKEDELGRPFVGKSGDLLTKILDAIGFKREDVFICNVLKHRPPGNRNPSKDEIVACRPFLLRQLELLDAKVILALGTFAAQTLLETDSPIGKLRGIEHRYHGIPLVATYHPAALLRNPNWKRPAWEDVQLARRIFDRP
jgi:uracil-DNA glycosylase